MTKPGDEVLVFAPYFPEYNPYINDTGARIKVVPADLETFQINFAEAEKYLTENVAAVLINTPNNPSGVLYSEETLEKLADLLTRKSAEFGHNVFLISDEPYREIIFDGKKAPYVAKFYPHTLTCYSFSKSLSVPGERIGYRRPGAHVRTDLKRNRPQLPVLADHAGHGRDSGRHSGSLCL